MPPEFGNPRPTVAPPTGGRHAARVIDLSLDTVTELLADAGRTCHAFHDATVCGVRAGRVQCDGIWAFTSAKAKNVAAAETAPEGA